MTVPAYLVAAYGVFWGLAFALVLSMWFRQRKLREEIDALTARLQRDGNRDQA